jgi:hypothetical protein
MSGASQFPQSGGTLYLDNGRQQVAVITYKSVSGNTFNLLSALAPCIIPEFSGATSQPP